MSYTSSSKESNINKINFTEDISGLVSQDFSDKKVLLYARERSVSGDLFRKYGDIIARNILNCKSYDIIADMKSPRDFALKTDKYTYADYTLDDWAIFRKILDLDAIIRNDRAFRNSIPYNEACKMIYSCAKFMITFFKEKKYDLLLINMIDFYVPDIIVRVAEHFEIPVISFCVNSFGLNSIMITKRGEPVFVREPKVHEIEELYQSLLNKNNPYVLNIRKAYKKVMMNFIRHKVKFLYHHLFLYKFLGKTDYIYKLTYSGTYPRNIERFIKLPTLFIRDITELKKLDYNLTVYIPLHYYPEATTDYWITHPNYTTYYPSLFETIKKYSERGYNILIKEHTAMYFYREFEFYEQLKSINNVYLISPFISTFDMFKLAEYVIVWTGTTGIEAAIHDKKVVIAYNEPYYSYGKLVKIGEENKATVLTEEEKRNMLRNILSSYLPII